MIASLPMYTHARLEAEHLRYWQLIRTFLREAGINSPAALSMSGDRYDIWTDDGLILSQTCGMPYRNRLHGHVRLVGTPDFGVDGCRPGYYHSVIVVRRDDPRKDIKEFREAVFAFNGEDSQSGFAAPYAHTKIQGFWFESRVRSGAHMQSAQFVAEGRADIAALFLLRHLRPMSMAAWAARVVFRKHGCDVPSHRCQRIWDVALRPQWGCLWV